jgi:molybdopterin-guanine dinucleotide biosynthesis protein A
MGSDKALALFGAVPLIQVAINTLADAGVTAGIAGSRSALGAFAEEIPDPFPESGPMAGVYAGLSASQSDWSLFLPVDLPLMPASLLACLHQRAQLTGSPVTIGTVNGRIQPFPAVLQRTILPHIAHRLAAGETACHRAWRTIPGELGSSLDAFSVESLVQCGHCHHPWGLPPALWFQSANTPAELAWLNRIRTLRQP